MSRSVTLLDYGVGNLLSVSRALEHCGAEVTRSGDPEDVARAERLVLPGVGAFGACVETLASHGLIEPVKTYAASGRPLLGICVGMQMLLDYGEEFGRHEGLGLIPGHVEAIPPTDSAGQPHKIPHIGWNGLHRPNGAESWHSPLFDAVPDGAEVYFVHSYTAVPSDPAHRLADCDYGGRTISAAVARDAVFGCQFHPEKSGPLGLAILDRFLSF